MHLPKVDETPGALIVQLSERRDQAVSFRSAQRVCVLAYPYHYRHGTYHGGPYRGAHRYISDGRTRFAELSRNKERHRNSAHWKRKIDLIRKGSSSAGPKNHCAPTGRGLTRKPDGNRRRIGSGSVR